MQYFTRQLSSPPLHSFLSFLFSPLQDEKNQMMTTNVWLKQVSSDCISWITNSASASFPSEHIPRFSEMKRIL